MGTRGYIGVRINGEDRGSYNHFDSYPSGLGVDFTKDALAMLQALDVYKQKAVDWKGVDANSEPTDEERKTYQKFWQKVSTGQDWYSLLRDLHGKLKDQLDLGLHTDEANFPLDSLFCEYAYIFNFDDGVVEYYKGFNKDWDAPGRFAKLAEKTKSRANGETVPNEYAGVRLVAAVPFEKMKDFLGKEESIGPWLEFVYFDKENTDDADQKLADLKTQLGSLADGLGAVTVILVKA